MIDVKAAYQIAREYINTRIVFIRKECFELKDSRVFELGLNRIPTESLNGAPLIKVDKDSGKVKYIPGGTPSEEFFDQWIKAPKIDLSKFLKCNE